MPTARAAAKYSRLAQSEPAVSAAACSSCTEEFADREQQFGSARLSARKSAEKLLQPSAHDGHLPAGGGNGSGSSRAVVRDMGPAEAEELRAIADDEVEDDDDEATLRDELKKRQRSQQAALYSTKLHALIWIVAAAGVAYAIDFFHVIFHDPRVSRTYFHIALGCTGVNVCITLYLTIYLRYIKKIMLEWSVYCPRMIPTNTVFGVVGALCYNAAFWNIWGLFTPGILLLLFLGSLMTAHFLPSV